MGWYEAIKDGINAAQKADNLPLMKNLLEAEEQIFELVRENRQLKEEIKELKEISNLEANVERHKDAYITLKDDPDKIIYCSCCWDTKRLLVQGQITNIGRYVCPSCKTTAYYDKNAYDRKQEEVFRSISQRTII